MVVVAVAVVVVFGAFWSFQELIRVRTSSKNLLRRCYGMVFRTFVPSHKVFGPYRVLRLIVVF